MHCQHCSKEYTNKSGYSNHVRRCPTNPNRIMETLTDAGRAKIVAKNLAHRHTNETKRKLSNSMKMAVLANPESYSSSNRGRTNQFIIDGIKLQGKWELDFYLWAKAEGLNPERPSVGFKYTWNGDRTYFPDFYLPSLDVYVEVKGYETERDNAKWAQFPKKLSVIKAKEIKEIRKGIFNKATLA